MFSIYLVNPGDVVEEILGKIGNAGYCYCNETTDVGACLEWKVSTTLRFIAIVNSTFLIIVIMTTRYCVTS